MTARDPQPGGVAATSTDCPHVVAVAGNAKAHRRIDAALESEGLHASTRLDAPSELADLATTAPTVIVFICDIDAPREMASLRRLCREIGEEKVVVISPPATGAGVRRVLDAGAHGLVFDPELERALPTTVRAVAIGQSVVPGEFRASVENPVLSHREHQVLALVRRGLTNAEIAERLFLAESTIKSHLASIFTKFGVRSRKEVAAALLDVDLLPKAPVATPGNGTSERAPA